MISLLRSEDNRTRRKAIVTYPNGDHYEGTLKGQLRDGEGVYTTLKGDVYLGEYRLGKKHGKGTYTMKDGTRYEGDFKDGTSIPSTELSSLLAVRLADTNVLGPGD